MSQIIVKPKIYNIIKAHHLKFDLPTKLNCLNKKKKWKIKNLIKNMLLDKKRTDKNIKFILLEDIGKACIRNKVSEDKITLTIKEFVNA